MADAVDAGAAGDARGDGGERSPDPVLGGRFTAALELAVELHREQARKGTRIPYLGHILGVAALVIEDGGSEDEIIAALLHDGPEDAGGEATLARIGERFGPEVKRIVAACSDTFETPKPPWRERKEAYLEHLEHAAPDELRVSLADKVHNARSVLADYRELGEELWSRFRGGREGTLWYYRSLAGIFARRCGGRLAEELERTVAELERLAGGQRAKARRRSRSPRSAGRPDRA